MKKYYSIDLGTSNLETIKCEKRAIQNSLNSYKEKIEKNPRYFNLCKGKINQLNEKLEELNKEAKETRRYIRKAKALEAA